MSDEIKISDESREVANQINRKVDKWVLAFQPVSEIEELIQRNADARVAEALAVLLKDTESALVKINAAEGYLNTRSVSVGMAMLDAGKKMLEDIIEANEMKELK